MKKKVKKNNIKRMNRAWRHIYSNICVAKNDVNRMRRFQYTIY